MQEDQLVGFESKAGITTSLIIAELNLEDVRSKNLHDSSDLPTSEMMLGQIFAQCADIQKFYLCGHFPTSLKSHSSSLTSENLLPGG